MRQRQRAEDRCDPCIAAPGLRDEEERDRRGDHQLPGRRRRQRQHGIRAPVPRPEADERELGGEHGSPEQPGAENGHSSLEHEHARERREQRRLVANDLFRIEPREPRDEREEAVPEWKGIPGMQAAVLELVDGAQVQARQVDELANAGLVKQAVSDDRALDVPQEPAEHHAEDPDRRPRDVRADAPARPGDQRHERDHGQNGHRQVNRAVQREDARPGDEHAGERPGERRGGRTRAQRPGDRQAGRQHHQGAEGEPQVLDHRITRAATGRCRTTGSEPLRDTRRAS